jgi:NADH dehydrogenase/NADH:ubiquinone oxidoreductase subunit G
MSSRLVDLLIDGRPVKASLGYTLMQTCSQIGVDVPRFCYHDKLLIAGNCRICLVEVAGSKKLVASCAVHVSNNMCVYTNTIRVRVARQNVLEFLLANHPLDCPICDQGGECDLQDITSVFGADRGRFYEFEKRAVLNKDFGPLIRTSMNRCIHCTRCVRFLTVSSGAAMLGMLGRGSASEISSYVNQFIYDELSGNITDLCPVGALTSKPYSFKARPWELTSIESLDIFDSLNSNLLLDVVANKISRVLPYSNELLNECWITNKARYAYDALFMQRLTACLFKVPAYIILRTLRNFTPSSPLKTNVKIYGKSHFVKVPLELACDLFILKAFDPSEPSNYFFSYVGGVLDLESTIAGKAFFNLLGVRNCAPACEFSANVVDFSFLYLFNTSLTQLSKLPSFCLLIGANTRFEAPLINLRLSKLVGSSGVSVYRIGGSVSYLNFKTRHLSNNISSFFEICEFKHPFCKNFYLSSFAYRPFILVGQSVFLNGGGFRFANFLFAFLGRLAHILDYSAALPSDCPLTYSGFGFLPLHSGRIHAFEIGLLPSILNLQLGGLNFSKLQISANVLTYSVGVDSLPQLFVSTSLVNNWLVYQGTHGIGLAAKANLVLPTLAYVERTTFYRNLLGLVQKAEMALSYDLGAKSNREIFKAVLDRMFVPAFYQVACFGGFSFLGGVSFNRELLINAELLRETQAVVTKIRFPLPLTYYSDASNQNSYLIIYGMCSLSIRSTTACAASALFTRVLFTAGLGKIFRAPLVSSILNYYGDTTSILILASKTMNLCSNLYLKRNNSFSLLYY